MSTSKNEVTVEFLEAFADAWNRHNIDDLMSFMTEDCVFEASGGDAQTGTRYEGMQAVRAGYAKAWADYPDARWNDATHFVQGNRGCSEWTLTATRPDGTRMEVDGCDLFTFVDGKIRVKASYLKNRQ